MDTKGEFKRSVHAVSKGTGSSHEGTHTKASTESALTGCKPGLTDAFESRAQSTEHTRKGSVDGVMNGSDHGRGIVSETLGHVINPIIDRLSRLVSCSGDVLRRSKSERLTTRSAAVHLAIAKVFVRERLKPKLDLLHVFIGSHVPVLIKEEIGDAIISSRLFKETSGHHSRDVTDSLQRLRISLLTTLQSTFDIRTNALDYVAASFNCVEPTGVIYRTIGAVR